MSKPEYSREFIYTVPESVFLDKELTLTDMRVYMFVRSFMDSHRECFASNRWFADKLGKTSRQIIYSLNKLESKKLIIRTEHNNMRTLEIPRTPLIMVEEQPVGGSEEKFTPHEEKFTGGCKKIHGGGEENFIHSSIVVKENDQKILLPSKAQILNNHPHSEPVVVSSTSLTLTPKVNPENPVNADRPGTTDKLLAAYRAKPIMRGNIMCEGDFLSAAYFSIDNRDKLTTTEQQRVNGICGLIRRGEFDEPPEWSLNLKRLRDRQAGFANASLQEIESAKKAILDPEVKGREDALAKMASMGLEFKAATEKKLCYPDKVVSIDSRPKKLFAKIELPEQEITDEYMKPDMDLLDELKLEK